MAGDMAAQADGAGKACDMGGVGQNAHAQGGGPPPQTLGADAQGIDPLQRLGLQGGVPGV